MRLQQQLFLAPKLQINRKKEHLDSHLSQFGSNLDRAGGVYTTFSVYYWTETKEEKELEYKKWNINALLGANCDNSNLSSTIVFIWEALLSSHQTRRIQFKLTLNMLLCNPCFKIPSLDSSVKCQTKLQTNFSV